MEHRPAADHSTSSPAARCAKTQLVCHSPAMRRLVELMAAVADSDCALLITGETGVGKEQVARAIHSRSSRRGRFVAINCAAIPPTLLERELFGHERGAFTGADRRRQGAFEAANGGTFLLDEIGELDPRLQVKLLRVLQQKEIVRLGSTEPVRVDVRFIATTNRELAAAVREGAFRPDLYYRLNTVELHVPPLRERRDDILPLCHEFLAAAAPKGRGPRSLSPRAARLLLNYHWPGNVRELQSVVERACLLCDGPRIEPSHLPPQLHGAASRAAGAAFQPLSAAPQVPLGPDSPIADFRQARRLFERGYFIHALALARGNISAAARHAGLSWKHFRHKMRELNIRPDAWRLYAEEP